MCRQLGDLVQIRLIGEDRSAIGLVGRNDDYKAKQCTGRVSTIRVGISYPLLENSLLTSAIISDTQYRIHCLQLLSKKVLKGVRLYSVRGDHGLSH